MSKLTRKIHYWGAIACLLPVLIVTVSGVFLLLKKEFDWIQPPTLTTTAASPELSLTQLLEIVVELPELEVAGWSDIDQLVIKPAKGVIKVRSRNHWEAQLNQKTGKVLQVSYRRSDTIEAIHDGSFFHDKAKLWIFLPASIILFVLSISGLYLFIQRILANRKKQKRLTKSASREPVGRSVSC